MDKTGHYEKRGDVEEWVWDEGSAPDLPSATGGWAVPTGEFDPRGEVDTRSASEKLAEAQTSPGLQALGDSPPEPKKTVKKVTAKDE